MPDSALIGIGALSFISGFLLPENVLPPHPHRGRLSKTESEVLKYFLHHGIQFTKPTLPD
jgi:hypothetical protein